MSAFFSFLTFAMIMIAAATDAPLWVKLPIAVVALVVAAIDCWISVRRAIALQRLHAALQKYKDNLI